MHINPKTIHGFPRNSRPIDSVVKIAVWPLARSAKRYRVRYRFNYKHLAADAILCLLLILSLQTTLSLPRDYFDDDLSIQTEILSKPIISGRTMALKIKLANTGKYLIRSVKVQFIFPEQFIFQGASRINFDQPGNWGGIGDLPPHTDYDFEIYGLALGRAGDELRLAAMFDFYKLNEAGIELRHEFNQTEQFSYSIEQSGVQLIIDSPAAVLPNQEFAAPLSLVNQTELVFDELYVAPVLGGDINLRTQDGAYFDERWNFYNIQPGAKISISPRLVADDQTDNHDLRFDVYGLYNDCLIKFSQAQAAVKNLETQLQAELKVLPDADKNPPTATVAIILKNQGAQAIENIEIRLEFAGRIWNLNSLSPRGLAKPFGALWTGRDWPVLKNIAPGQEQSLAITIDLKDQFNSRQPATVAGTISYWENGRLVNRPLVRQTVAIAADFNVSAYARYYSESGERLGQGPLPPRAGEKTHYWIYWQADNRLSDVKNITLTARLPVNVNWNGNFVSPAGGQIIYNEQSREIVWRIDKIRPEDYSYSSAFEVELIPRPAEKNSAAKLIQQIQAVADFRSGGPAITKSIPDVTTYLFEDSFGSLAGELVH